VKEASPFAFLFFQWLVCLFQVNIIFKKEKKAKEARISRYNKVYWCEVLDVKYKNHMMKISFAADGKDGKEGPL